MKIFKKMKVTRNLIVFIALLTITLSGCFQDDLGDIRENITGTWRCQEESALFEVQYYDVQISKDTDDEQGIIVYNFFDSKMNVRVEINGNSLTIPLQEIDGWEISGTGEISDNFEKISWEFTADNGNGPEDVFAYYTGKSPVATGFLAEN
jgi:hypothetical protein